MATTIEFKEGFILQDGEPIATVSPEGVVSHEKTIAPATKGRIKEAIKEAGGVFGSFALEGKPEAEDLSPEVHESKPKILQPTAPPTPEELQVQPPIVVTIQAPGEPTQDPLKGCKDPVWLAWKASQK